MSQRFPLKPLCLLVLQALAIAAHAEEVADSATVAAMAGSAYFPDFGVIMLAAMLATLPTLVVFFAMQRQFVQGMLGSVK